MNSSLQSHDFRGWREASGRMVFIKPNEVVFSTVAVLVMVAAISVLVFAYCLGTLVYVLRRSVAIVSHRGSVICGTLSSTLDVGSILSTPMM